MHRAGGSRKTTSASPLLIPAKIPFRRKKIKQSFFFAASRHCCVQGNGSKGMNAAPWVHSPNSAAPGPAPGRCRSRVGAGTQPVTPGQAAHCKSCWRPGAVPGSAALTCTLQIFQLWSVRRHGKQEQRGGVISKPSCLAADGDLQGKCCWFCVPEVAGLCPLEGRVAAAKGPRGRGGMGDVPRAGKLGTAADCSVCFDHTWRMSRAYCTESDNKWAECGRKMKSAERRRCQIVVLRGVCG